MIRLSLRRVLNFRPVRWLHERWQLTVVAGLISSVMLFGLFIIFHFYVVPGMVQLLISQQSKLQIGSRIMERWLNPSYKMHFKVYVFSVTNSKEILKGAIPVLQKSGPFVFDKALKHELMPSPPGTATVSFRRKAQYFFNQSASCPDCKLSNRVVVPNLVYQKFVELASNERTRETGKNLLAQSPFINVNVGELLFEGYEDPFISNICNLPIVSIICLDFMHVPERIGLFFGMNDSYTEGTYTIKDGTNKLSSRAEVLTYEGMQQLRESWWLDKEARTIRGIEGTLFHPFIQRNETLWAFCAQLCRSIPLDYECDTSYRGVPVYRFRVSADEFDSTLPDNVGFCHPTQKIFVPQQNKSANGRHCYPRGIMPVAHCIANEPPVVLSLPNFNLAPKEIQNAVAGMEEPDNERDAIFADIEPSLGVPIRAHRRIQLNAEFWAGKDIVAPAYHKKIRSTIIPLAIVHDDAEIDDDSLHMIKWELIYAQQAAYAGTYLILLASIVMATVSLFYWFFMAHHQQRRKDFPENYAAFTSPDLTLPDLAKY